jgi:hypothetical protein
MEEKPLRIAYCGLRIVGRAFFQSAIRNPQSEISNRISTVAL